MSKVSSHCRVNGTVRSIAWVATTLPSTFNVPVAGRPRPLRLLNASVAKPRPSYLKSYSIVCFPGASASAPSQRTRFHVVQLVEPMDSVIRHRGGQVPRGPPNIGVDRGGVTEQVRLPLAGVAADEAV